MIRLDVTNQSATKKIDFQFRVESRDSIYPEKVLSTALVFERPIDAAKYLRLTLSGKAVGEEGELRFEIPAAMIQKR